MKKIIIVIHWYSLEGKKLRDVMLGHPNSKELGLVIKALFLARKYTKAQLIFSPRDSLTADGIIEADYVRILAHSFVEFGGLAEYRLFDGMVHRERENLVKIIEESTSLDEGVNTWKTFDAVSKLFSSDKDDELEYIHVSLPGHMQKVLQSACDFFNKKLKNTNMVHVAPTDNDILVKMWEK